MRISDWSSDVCSSDLGGLKTWLRNESMNDRDSDILIIGGGHNGLVCAAYLAAAGLKVRVLERRNVVGGAAVTEEFFPGFRNSVASRSEEHTSELQSLMRISYAVFCLKKKKTQYDTLL